MVKALVLALSLLTTPAFAECTSVPEFLERVEKSSGVADQIFEGVIAQSFTSFVSKRMNVDPPSGVTAVLLVLPKNGGQMGIIQLVQGDKTCLGAAAPIPLIAQLIHDFQRGRNA